MEFHADSDFEPNVHLLRCNFHAFAKVISAVGVKSRPNQLIGIAQDRFIKPTVTAL